jgi:hypothetical protein
LYIKRDENKRFTISGRPFLYDQKNKPVPQNKNKKIRIVYLFFKYSNLRNPLNITIDTIAAIIILKLLTDNMEKPKILAL